MTGVLYAEVGISGGGFGSDSRLLTYDDDGMGGFIANTVGSTGRIIPGGGDAMTFHPATNIIYAVTASGDGTPNDLLSIDPATGTPTLIAGLSISGVDQVFDIDFRSDGVLFALVYLDSPNETHLMTVNITSGVCTDLGLVNAGFKAGCLCFDAADVLWTAINITSKKLCTVNQSTGALSVVFASLTNNTTGLNGNGTFDGGSYIQGASGGVFYAFEEKTTSGRLLVTVDTVGGTIDTTSFNDNSIAGDRGALAWSRPPSGPRVSLRFRAA